MLRKMSATLIGLILVTAISTFSYGQSELNLTDKENAPVKEKIKDTKVAQKPKESPMDKALIGLWQAIEFINKFAVTIKGDEPLYLITPRGATTTTRPIFEWTPVANAGGYYIDLSDSHGENWKIRTAVSTFTYPESREELPCGTYTWKVESFERESGKSKSCSDPVKFEIISEEEKSQLEGELQSVTELLVSGYILTGSIYLEHLFYNEAISNFQKAIDIAQNNPYAHLGLAKSYTAIGKEANVEWEEVLSYFNQAIKLAPANFDLHAGLALAYEAMGKTEEAQVEWEKAKDSGAYYLYKNETK